MKFNLIDKIEYLDDTRVVACKSVSLAEEYLADHFPTFPVLPGVMMLEALTQAAGWLLHHRSGFAASLAVLHAARNVRYGNFVVPGQTLRVEVEHLKSVDKTHSFKGTGTVDSRQALTARLDLNYYNLADEHPSLADVDRQLLSHTRSRWNLIKPTAGSDAPTPQA